MAHPCLPITSGNPQNPVGDWGIVTNFIVDNQNKVSFSIDYLGNIYNINDITFEGDLDFVDKSNDILYYHDPNTGDKMLYFNFGETLDSALFMARTFSSVENWKGEALWNLSKNEVKTTNKLNVYNYIPEIDDDGNVYSYFYMPDVPIDNLISVSTILPYRVWNDGFLGIGGSFSDVNYKTVAAVKGQSSSVNPSWVETTYTTAYIAGALTSVATIAGVIPGYGWAIAGVTFLSGALLQTADINEWFAYDVDQIQHVIPPQSLTNEINSYIRSIGGDDTFSPDTDKLYKLHLASFSKPKNVQIMKDEYFVTQVVWESDGEIYVVDEDNIDSFTWGPGTELPDAAKNNDNTVMIIGSIIIFFVLYNALELKKKPGLLIIVVGGIIYVLYYLGVV